MLSALSVNVYRNPPVNSLHFAVYSVFIETPSLLSTSSNFQLEDHVILTILQALRTQKLWSYNWLLNFIPSSEGGTASKFAAGKMAPCGFGFIICVLSMLTSSLGFPKPSEVVVLGSVAVDFVAYTSSLPQLGETVLGSSFSKNFGGKGANQVVLIAVTGKFIP